MEPIARMALFSFARCFTRHWSCSTRKSICCRNLYHRSSVVVSPPNARLRQFTTSAAMAQQTAAQESAASSSKDIVERIKKDHSELDDYYNKYKTAVKGGDKQAALEWFNQFVWEICRHSVSEELVLYPLLERLGDGGAQLADKSRSDHRRVKEMLSDMLSINEPLDFEPMMDRMMKDLREHISLEEEDLQLIRDKLSLSERETAGATFGMGKLLAPTRPHTMVPEKPVVLEAALGLLATPMDKLRDMFTSFPSSPDEKKSK